MKETTRLERLIGKEFIYKQENIRIKDYYPETENGIIKIITDGSPIDIPEDDIKKFVGSLLPVEDPETYAISTEVIQRTNSLIGSLQETLLENIDRVKEDPSFVKQANVVNSSVNALIGIAKLQIQAGRLAKKN